jgi:hypothetical protein
MAFINDFIESKDTHTSSYRSLFSRTKNYIFASLTFPLAFNVGGIFWLLFIIDRDLVVSEELQEVSPEWYTHMLRTNIMIFVVIEMICLNRQYPRHLHALIGLLTVLFAYIAWTLVILLITDHWVYPIFDDFNWQQRVAFYGFNIFVPVTFYFMGDLINTQIWKRRSKGTKTLQRKRSQKDSSSRHGNKPDLIITDAIERSTEV